MNYFFYIPDEILPVFNPATYEDNTQKYILAEGDSTTSNALLTNFVGQIDIRESIEFTNPETSHNFIQNVNKVSFMNYIPDESTIAQRPEGLDITTKEFTINNIGLMARLTDISNNFAAIVQTNNQYDLSMNQFETDISNNFHDITILDQALFTTDTSLNTLTNTVDTMKQDITNRIDVSLNTLQSNKANINNPNFTGIAKFSGTQNVYSTQNSYIDMDLTAQSVPKCTNGLVSGVGDGFTYDRTNIQINSFFGLGFNSTFSGNTNGDLGLGCHIIMNMRQGSQKMKGYILAKQVFIGDDVSSYDVNVKINDIINDIANRIDVSLNDIILDRTNRIDVSLNDIILDRTNRIDVSLNDIITDRTNRIDVSLNTFSQYNSTNTNNLSTINEHLGFIDTSLNTLKNDKANILNPIFNGNATFAQTENIYATMQSAPIMDSTAITNFKCSNGLVSGGGDGSNYTNCNVMLNSFNGVAFNSTCADLNNGNLGLGIHCFINNRQGKIVTKGPVITSKLLIGDETSNIDVSLKIKMILY